jgi:2-dehydropantoate 2-reductase
VQGSPDSQRVARAADSAATVLVHGAGAIGLYLGGRLAAAGVPVHFVGRPRVVDVLRREGLALGGLDGSLTRIAPDRFGASTGLAAAPPPGLALLCVKGGATAAAAAELQAACPPGTPVISFQNGVENLARMQQAAPALQAIAGMVPFNVLRAEPHRAEQTTSGQLTAARCAITEAWAPRFAAAGLPLVLEDDMQAVQWGKLLLNLNNPLNALAGLPLLAQLGDPAFRRLLATLQQEALAALRAAGIRPARATPLPNRWLPTLLRQPTPLFRLLARRMLTIHPQARLSMHADRSQGRPTEVDDLCGAVVRLAESHGLTAPANRAVQRLIETAPHERLFSAEEIAAALAAPPCRRLRVRCL